MSCIRNQILKMPTFVVFPEMYEDFVMGFQENNWGYPRLVHTRISNGMCTCPRKRVHLSAFCTVYDENRKALRSLQVHE